MIPVKIRFPLEGISITEAYPELNLWATSNGVEELGWFLKPDLSKVNNPALCN